MKPWRAAETSATASGKSTRIPSRKRDRLLVGRAVDVHLLERGAGQLDRRVERERRELLALRLLHRLGLPLRELAQPAHQVFRVASQREAESTFHGVLSSVSPRNVRTDELRRRAQRPHRQRVRGVAAVRGDRRLLRPGDPPRARRALLPAGRGGAKPRAHDRPVPARRRPARHDPVGDRAARRPSRTRSRRSSLRSSRRSR